MNYSKASYQKFLFYFLPKATITAKMIPKIAPPDIDPVPPELITSMVSIPGKPESFFARIFASFFAALPEPSESTRSTMRRFFEQYIRILRNLAGFTISKIRFIFNETHRVKILE